MVADLASLMVLVVLCFPRGGLPLPLLVLIVVSGIFLACYAANDLGLHPAVRKLRRCFHAQLRTQDVGRI